ncbi:hypothetical protein [Nocardia farcinica]|uniref:hypothetical protein n=1 Tax=Nocardia farcinica TaxID=37329 RepID=UPI0015F085B2|nr:hypothetical protein [Nocardia farcinica]MBA4855304.1 hypothetical protein [Nocardia farcinica]MBC9817701.1 hypothetical protein [Nocardia farcinica]
MRTATTLALTSGAALALAFTAPLTATADPLTDFLCTSGSAQFCPPSPPVAPPPRSQDCHPSYDPCLPRVIDVDCAGGSGDGPVYTGRVRVIGPDDYDLDRDGNGIGCESS